MSDKIAVVLELTREEAEVLHLMMLRGARWTSSPVGLVAENIFTALDRVRGLDFRVNPALKGLYPHLEESVSRFPTWRVLS